jgi:hypothetical protein
MSADLRPHQINLLYQIDAAINANWNRIVAQARRLDSAKLF